MRGETQSSVLATVGVAAAVVGLTVAQPLATVAAPVVLAALVVEGSSTNQSGEGVADFFHGKFKGSADPLLVNFLTGPFGIWRALAGSPDEHNTVMSSGWGAANASLLVGYLGATDPHGDMLTKTTWVLDNNVANPNGGFGTRYPAFALIGVNPIPTAAPEGATVISTAYEYDINGNAPQFILNPVADLNSLAAYFSRRLTQADLPMPVDADGTIRDPDGAALPAGSCTVTCRFEDYPDGNGGTVTVRVTTVGGVTYVGYETEHLPLVQPLIDHGGEPGAKIAGVIEPALTAAVDYGYPDNDPLANPGTLERAALVPSRAETERFVKQFAEGVKTGLDSLNSDDTAKVAVLQDDSDSRPVRNVLREAARFSPSGRFDGIGATRTHRPPKPVAISVKNALDRLSKAFAPKRTHQRAGGEQPSSSSDAGE